MSSPILEAIEQICEEKNIPLVSVIETIEAALAAAYRKDFGRKNQNIKVSYDPQTNTSSVFDFKIVVPDEILTIESEEGSENPPKKFNPKTEIILSEALKLKKDIKVGEELRMPLAVPPGYGRMAAQTAKQVLMQKLRESERQNLYDEFKTKEHEVTTGMVQRREGNVVLIDLGRLTAILPPSEQIEREKYNPGARLKVFITSVVMGMKGPEVTVSRTHPDIVKKLFFLEIPEVANGMIEIKSIAREAGARTKIAVFSHEPNLDPIGSCVGQRGTRVQTIIGELGGEKIDIIQYSEDPIRFISNALSPAKISNIVLQENEKTALVTVKDQELSLAIGRGGQNVRLASKLTSWKINIAGLEKEDQQTPKEETVTETEITKS